MLSWAQDLQRRNFAPINHIPCRSGRRSDGSHRRYVQVHALNLHTVFGGEFINDRFDLCHVSAGKQQVVIALRCNPSHRFEPDTLVPTRNQYRRH